ncbi:MAG: hypothetical protein Tsb0021_15660 [Chlamydiales bacterium]
MFTPSLIRICTVFMSIIIPSITLATATQSLAFPEQLEMHIMQILEQELDSHPVEGIPLDQVKSYILSLTQEGLAEMRGRDKECRSVCVTAQGGIEVALKQMLESGEVKEVSCIFLTPLPTTPLRKRGDTANLSSVPFEAARQYTLDRREFSLRELRDAGATVTVAYSREKYEELKKSSSEGDQEQVKIWEEEKQHPNVVDTPLDTLIPSELVGALYIIHHNEGLFYLPTQGIQAHNASEATAIWRMWLSNGIFGPHEATLRACLMAHFIHSNSLQN